MESLLVLLKLLFDMKLLTFLWYSFWYAVTVELPFLVLDIVALLLANFSLIWFMVFFSFLMCLALYVCFSSCCLYRHVILCATW